MKKIFKTLFCFIMICFTIAVPFTNANLNHNQNVTTVAAAENPAFNEIMRDVRITQDGYVFGKKDFEISQDQSKTIYTLYVNTSITITHLSKVYDLQITISTLGDNYTTTKLLEANEFYGINFNGSTEHVYEITLYQWLLGGGGKTFKFRLMQTPLNFNVNPSYEWTDYNNKQVIAPSATDSYIDEITLSGINGTQNSPVFVDFYFNGEFYSVYNINGIYYNTLTDNKLQETELVFNMPGQYEVYLYDKTCYKVLKEQKVWHGTSKERTFKALDTEATDYSSYANREFFAFSIEQSYANLTSENMYVLAKDEHGNTIVSNQTVNSSVNIQFFNLDVRVIGKIEVLKYYSSLSGTNIPSIELLFPETYPKLSDLNSTTITYTDDSSYAINIYDKTGQPIWSSPFKFTILKDIHNSYGSLSSTDRSIVPENNKIYSINQSEIHETSFNGFHEIIPTIPEQVVSLQSSTTTQYVVQLARANSGIDGVNQNEVINGGLELSFRGVGNITVYVYRDGSLAQTKVVTDGNSVALSDAGSYKIVARDQMGTELTKSFTIKQSLTGPTIALIAIGGVAAVLLIFFIIRTRTKIKVR